MGARLFHDIIHDPEEGLDPGIVERGRVHALVQSGPQANLLRILPTQIDTSGQGAHKIIGGFRDQPGEVLEIGVQRIESGCRWLVVGARSYLPMPPSPGVEAVDDPALIHKQDVALTEQLDHQLVSLPPLEVDDHHTVEIQLPHGRDAGVGEDLP